MKIVINKCYGGFNLSDEGFEWLIKNKGWGVTNYNEYGNCEDSMKPIVKSDEVLSRLGFDYSFTQMRNDSSLRINEDLIECVETLGTKANTRTSNLEIIEIPDDVDFTIEEYDGIERVAEKHRTWS